MSWFWNDWVLIGIAVAFAAIGFSLGYLGIINGELAIFSLVPLAIAVIVVFWFGMIWAFKVSIEAIDRFTGSWPKWARGLIGISSWRDRPQRYKSRHDHAQN